MKRKRLFTDYEIKNAPTNTKENPMRHLEPDYRYFPAKPPYVKEMHIIRVKNTLAGRKLIETWRKSLKGTGVQVRARGRDNDRKALFAKTGRYYCSYSANGNDISFNSPEGHLCREFMVYVVVPTGVRLSKYITF
jgi:hypothetical protein